MTVALHPDDRRLLQEVAALLRGLMAAIPRPTPPGDWGRGQSAPERALRRAHEARSMPIIIESEVPRGPETEPAEKLPKPLRVAKPPKPVRIPVPKVRPLMKNRKHTPESIREHARMIDGWLSELGMNATDLCRAAGINSGIVSFVRTGVYGLSEKAEAKLVAAVEKLRKRRAAR